MDSLTTTAIGYIAYGLQVLGWTFLLSALWPHVIGHIFTTLVLAMHRTVCNTYHVSRFAHRVAIVQNE